MRGLSTSELARLLDKSRGARQLVLAQGVSARRVVPPTLSASKLLSVIDGAKAAGRTPEQFGLAHAKQVPARCSPRKPARPERRRSPPSATLGSVSQDS